MLTEADRLILLHACNLHASIIGKRDAGKSVPASDFATMKSMLEQLGATPAARSKVSASAKPSKANAFSDVRKA